MMLNISLRCRQKIEFWEEKMKKVQFTETVLRDANQSLIATRLPYDKFEPILEKMDQAGFYSVECWGGATFDVCLRFLNEDPWERLRKIRAKMPNTKLQMLLRGQNILGYKHYPTMSSAASCAHRSKTASTSSAFSTRSTIPTTSRSLLKRP